MAWNRRDCGISKNVRRVHCTPHFLITAKRNGDVRVSTSSGDGGDDANDANTHLAQAKPASTVRSMRAHCC